MTASRTLAQHFASTAYDKLAGNRLHDMKRLLLDYCGVAISGSQADTGRLARQFVVDSGGAPQASVIGARARVPAANAAFANAVAEHSIELDDVDDEALFHYGPPVVSSALAVAEWKHANGRDLLTAMLAGCEMTNRLSLATNPELRNRGFHTTPTCGVFGATVAAGRLLGLDAEHMTSALGLAGTQACGLMEMYGPSMQKRINPGPAARNGVTAAALADIGIIFDERGHFVGEMGADDSQLVARRPLPPHRIGGHLPPFAIRTGVQHQDAVQLARTVRRPETEFRLGVIGARWGGFIQGAGIGLQRRLAARGLCLRHAGERDERNAQGNLFQHPQHSPPHFQDSILPASYGAGGRSSKS